MPAHRDPKHEEERDRALRLLARLIANSIRQDQRHALRGERDKMVNPDNYERYRRGRVED